MDYLSGIEADLRAGTDRSEELDELFQLCLFGSPEEKEKASWCVAKMGQNKVPDMRILDILYSIRDELSPQIRENVAWGIGEVAGAGIGDGRSVSAMSAYLSDADDSVRAMAVWAVGRLRHKMGLAEELLPRIREMSDDESGYVRKCVQFALQE